MLKTRFDWKQLPEGVKKTRAVVCNLYGTHILFISFALKASKNWVIFERVSSISHGFVIFTRLDLTRPLFKVQFTYLCLQNTKCNSYFNRQRPIYCCARFQFRNSTWIFPLICFHQFSRCNKRKIPHRQSLVQLKTKCTKLTVNLFVERTHDDLLFFLSKPVLLGG